ncbi:hypothetical protein [Synechococcus sp. CBW1006]|uniref:hypothetical protein n=1 Tax=Synechococcus sp. CBW1006 TaxID=1353138 RepID=UPI0018CC92B6|nr:hypothetical protein [Synechococcus sp. CBW1006]QPN66421.1 hypothetical protein H8F26_16980 [Synechococcus sp. CBW1006]
MNQGSFCYRFVGAGALPQQVCNRRNMENSWHRSRDTQRQKGAQRDREDNGVQIMATLRSLTMDALHFDGFWSIIKDLAALSHDIKGLLPLLGWREPAQAISPE